MSSYDFKCAEHGMFEVIQSMNDSHVATCPACGKVADRIFYPITFKGDLPYGKPKLGQTRNELFDNLQKEGFAHKDWRKSDEQTKESLAGTQDKMKKEGII